jgi:MATE family multidrug resistance protein
MKDRATSYKALFSVSLPLVLSMAATTVMEFTDRVFLSNYAIDAIAAAMPAGIAAFLILTFFTGVTTYLNVFVAQYTGAGSSRRIGPCIWQGIYFSIMAAVILVGLSFAAHPIFQLGGHPPEVQKLERIYFRVLCLGGGFNVLGTCLASFFTGRGKTRPVMLINMIGMAFNIPLDYALINGVWFFPEMGIQGAGIATVCSWALIALLFAWLIFDRSNERRYGMLSGRAFDGELFWRIIRKGVPAALQFTMDVLAFTFFVFWVGRLGKIELAVSNIALSIQSIAFMPAFGFSMGLSTLVGQSLGRNDVEGALRFTNKPSPFCWPIRCCWICSSYWHPSGFSASSSRPAGKAPLTGSCWKWAPASCGSWPCSSVSTPCILHLSGSLKGAGDTRFIMWSIGLATLIVMVLPLTIIVEYTEWGLFASWIVLTLYVITLFAISFLRFRQGKWKTIRVI